MPLLIRPRARSLSILSWAFILATIATAVLGEAVLSDALPCAPFTVPSYGYITVGPSSTVTVTTDIVYTPVCTPYPWQHVERRGSTNGTRPSDPFHASITPQAYATGAATVIAWMLVIMLLITPRTFFSGQAGEAVTGLRGRRGLIGGARGGSSVIGIGSRPWLQKVAALTVAISLTIASVDTFRVAEQQYYSGSMNADDLRNEVVSSTRIKISRVVSDIFLWLAQIQTLIRLFSRHKEKVLIKWIGFAMIILDVTFSCLNTFISTKSKRDQKFVDAIPALNYLFQLALSMLYAAWVIYYAITKRRYAFYHKLMWNISVVALLSILSILTPVVFFITDISNSSVAGWGDYFRWVGAAAASVIVWEWVERIEALEREEKKDGILGREVFDGDEMLDLTPQEGVVAWPSGRKGFGRSKGVDGAGGGLASGLKEHGFGILTKRIGRVTHREILHRNVDHDAQRNSILSQLEKGVDAEGHSAVDGSAPQQARPVHLPVGLVVPQPVASPISRSDTISAASTVYAVRYWPVGQSPPLQRQDHTAQTLSKTPDLHVDPQLESRETSRNNATLDRPESTINGPEQIVIDPPRHGASQNISSPAARFDIARHFTNPFKRHKALPPAVIANAQVIEPLHMAVEPKESQSQDPAKRDLRFRLGQFATKRIDRIRERGMMGDETEFPVTIIPAMPRGRTWSPQDPAMLNNEPQTSAAPPGAGSSGVDTIIESQEESQDSQSQAMDTIRGRTPPSDPRS